MPMRLKCKRRSIYTRNRRGRSWRDQLRDPWHKHNLWCGFRMLNSSPQPNQALSLQGKSLFKNRNKTMNNSFNKLNKSFYLGCSTLLYLMRDLPRFVETDECFGPWNNNTHAYHGCVAFLLPKYNLQKFKVNITESGSKRFVYFSATAHLLSLNGWEFKYWLSSHGNYRFK